MSSRNALVRTLVRRVNLAVLERGGLGQRARRARRPLPAGDGIDEWTGWGPEKFTANTDLRTLRGCLEATLAGYRFLNPHAPRQVHAAWAPIYRCCGFGAQATTLTADVPDVPGMCQLACSTHLLNTWASDQTSRDLGLRVLLEGGDVHAALAAVVFESAWWKPFCQLNQQQGSSIRVCVTRAEAELLRAQFAAKPEGNTRMRAGVPLALAWQREAAGRIVAKELRRELWVHI